MVIKYEYYDENTGEFKLTEQTDELQKKHRDRALKAWKTIRERKKFSNHVKDYNTDNKNSFRNKVIKSFKELREYGWTEYDRDDFDIYYNRYCLILESPQFLFINQFKKKFIVIEHNYNQYIEMCKKLPQQVTCIYNADISLARQLPYSYSCAFLDFCNTFDSLKKLIEWIKPKIEDCEKIAFTFSLRGNKKDMEDYKFDLISKLQKILPNFDVEYGHAYRDGSPMIGLILKNRNDSSPNRFVSGDVTKDEIRMWCEVACKKQFGHELYEWGDPIINPRATVNRVKNFEKCKWLFDNLPFKYKKMIREWSTPWRFDGHPYVRYGGYGSKCETRGTLFDFFIDAIC